MKINALYYGDNLDILRRYIKDESVDLIYLDPPFNSKATYNVLFREKNGSRSTAQIKVFEDTWHWDNSSEAVYKEVVEGGGPASRAMQAFRQLLGENDMLAYLAMMAPRLIELHRVLSKTGSMYLHCDSTASHYLKILLDSIFRPRNFRNEIVWCYTSGGVSKRYFSKKHDILLFYSKTDKYTFNPQYRPYSPGTLQRGLTKVKGPKYKLRKEGALLQDWWDIQKTLSPTAKERLGFPTQKPEVLLERIIKASSNEGDLVLDPFCGCGTTVAVAQRLERRWIGIDVTHLAITLMKHRLHDAFGDEVKFKVIGEPVALTGARALAKQDRFQFEWWALGLVDARPADPKKGSDKGIDGRLYFHDDEKGDTKQVILSVKSGKVQASHIRDLRAVVDREKAQVGALLTLEKPTRPMVSEAAGAGFYDSPWGTQHPKIQIRTVKELLDGKRLDIPPTKANVTFKKGKRVKPEGPEAVRLFESDDD